MKICENNSEKLYHKYKYMIKNIIDKTTNNIHDKEDLNQEAYFILLKSIKNFDVNKNTKFSTYLYSCLTQKIKTIIKKTQPECKKIDKDLYKQFKNKIKKYDYTNNDIKRIENEIIDKCSQKYKNIIKMKISGVNINRIAEKNNCTKQNISAIINKEEQKIIRKME